MRAKEQNRKKRARGTRPADNLRRNSARPTDDGVRRSEQRVSTETARRNPHRGRARNATAMMALDPGALGGVPMFSVGMLGGCTRCKQRGCACEERLVCTYCGALLFKGEAKQAKRGERGPFGTKWHGGQSCCAEGKVQLPPIKRDAAFEAMWNDHPTRKLLTANSRRFNNAMCLASAYAKQAPTPGGSWNPSIVMQGKLHHRFGGITGTDGERRYAQLYVNDPAAADDDVVLEQRMTRMLLNKSASEAYRRRCKGLLSLLTDALRGCNPYVKDVMMAGEIFLQEDAPRFSLSIDPDKAPPDADRRTYSANNQRKTFNEVTVLCDESPAGRSILLRRRDGTAYETHEGNRAYDPLHFVLLMPCGDNGWHPYIPLHRPPPPPPPIPPPPLPASSPPDAPDLNAAMLDDAVTDAAVADDAVAPGAEGDTTGWAAHRSSKQRAQVACRAYYAHRLHVRGDDPQHFDDALHRGSRLFQEYCCMALAKVEMQKLRWHRDNQKTIRAELYQNLADAVHTHDQASGQAVQAGRRVILASSFTGGPRDQQQRFHDSMAVVRRIGTPSFFITMTCNPQWPEIVDSLLPDQKPEDRPDLTARVFSLKLSELMADLTKDGIFGKTVAHMHVIEFQHRGLPHAHILIILAKEDRLKTVSDIDECVSAELPVEPLRAEYATDAQFDAAHASWVHLSELICKHMLHGPCGRENPRCPCMEDGVCKKKFPKEFSHETRKPDDQIYPVYRRRRQAADGRPIQYSYKGRLVDNRWVVPFSPYLLKKYECHLNVEACVSVQGIKCTRREAPSHSRSPCSLTFDPSSQICTNMCTRVPIAQWSVWLRMMRT